MKVLILYTRQFSYTTAEKNLPEQPDVSESREFTNGLVAFIQVETEDEQYDILSREKKLVNHLKWAARKNSCNLIILHSFAHLSESKASIDFTRSVFDAAQQRLENAGYEVAQTPFGYFLDLKIDAPGFSLARIWATL
jgi:hypothetical protein